MSSTYDNTRIAKNTLMLYVRMIILTCISLYTSRINLQLLGIIDYGIYNAVGGLVGMFAIISGSISVAISRYLTYELGTGNYKRVNEIFCASIIIQALLSVVIIIIAETIGLWFLNAKMNIPADRMYAASWVFQCSIISFAIGLISIPYNALIVSHEKMSAFAYISILEGALKLIVCFCLYISPFDRLILWAVMLLLVQLLLRFLYGLYCERHFPESKFHFNFDTPLIKEMSKFIGWAALGNGAVVIKDQGTSLLLNIFCGPAVNAARGVAMQVNNITFQLVNNLMMAVNPQITKSFSSGELNNMHGLIIRSGKLSFLLLSLIFFPLWPNIKFLLGIWLVQVPEYTAPFVMLILAYSMLDCFGSPLVTGVLAEGNIKRYEIELSAIYLANIAASYFLLKAGYSPVWTFVLNILFKLIVVIALLLQSQRKYNLPIVHYIKHTVRPCLAVFSICSVFALFLRLPIKNEWWNFLGSVGIISVFTLAVIYFLGLTKKESAFILNQIKTKIKRTK